MIVDHSVRRFAIWGHPLCSLVILLSITRRDGTVAVFNDSCRSWTRHREQWYAFHGSCALDQSGMGLEANDTI